MQQLAPIFVVTIVFIISLSARSEAKRGCAMYGHSCYGGHGKRSDIQPSLMGDDQPPIIQTSSNNKEIANPSYNVRGPNNNDGVFVRSASDREIQFSIYDILNQMMENARRSREANNEIIAAEELYKSNNNI